MKNFKLTTILILICANLNAIAVDISLSSPAAFIPKSLGKTCSSSFVESRNSDNIFYITALHCMYNNKEQTIILYPKVTDISIMRLFRGDTKVTIPYNRIKKFFHYDTAVASFNSIYDFEIDTKSPGDIDINTYTLAMERPRIGDSIFIVGFPANGKSYQKALRIKCRYTGRSYSLVKPYLNYTIQSNAECENIGQFQGASGGAILNTNNEYIGTFTSTLNFVAANGKKHILYTEITENNVHNNMLYPGYYNQVIDIDDAIKLELTTNREKIKLRTEFDKHGHLIRGISENLDGSDFQEYHFEQGRIIQ